MSNLNIIIDVLPVGRWHTESVTEGVTLRGKSYTPRILQRTFWRIISPKVEIFNQAVAKKTTHNFS